MIGLRNKKCVPCEGGVAPMTKDEIANYIKELQTKWLVFNLQKLRREFRFKGFKDAMLFVNKVAAVAERERHHPDIAIHYNSVVIELWTHAIGGLSENDFIMAAKIEALE